MVGLENYRELGELQELIDSVVANYVSFSELSNFALVQYWTHEFLFNIGVSLLVLMDFQGRQYVNCFPINMFVLPIRKAKSLR